MAFELNSAIKQLFELNIDKIRNISKSNFKEFFPEVGFLFDSEKVKLEKILNVKIKNVSIYEQALTHRSYLQIINNKKYFSNERLEFLGDAILNMVIAEFLFFENKLLEGDLTKMRSWIVNKQSLAICAKELGLMQFIKLSYGAEESVKRGSENIIADTVEAIIASIYLDKGLKSATNFIIEKMIPIIRNQSFLEDANYKSMLLEKMQAKSMTPPKYEILESNGPDHEKIFVIGAFNGDKLIGKGTGKTRKSAEQDAARNSLNEI
jgi:ribonuclease-3